VEVVIPRGTVIMALFVCVAGCLGGIGYAASPRDEAGRPVLLAPDVRAMERYRRTAQGCVEAWKAVDAGLEGVLAGEAGDLLAVSQQAQRAFQRSVGLAQEVDAAKAPPALLGLHELALATARRYLEASAAVARWLSAPSAENRAAAEKTLRAARNSLAALETNAWLKAREEQP
jgi:hypothetical protein